MTYRPAAALLAVALLAACNQQKPAETSTVETTAANTAAAPALNAFFEHYWERQSRLEPLGATSQGDNRFNDQLPNSGTQAYRREVQDFCQYTLDSLRTFDRAKLTANDQISYDMLTFDLETRLKSFGLGGDGGANFWQMPFYQIGGLPLTMGQIGSGEGFQPFKTVQDYDNWLGRVHGFVAWSDTAVADFRTGLRTGRVLPRTLVLKMIPQLRELQVTDPTKSLFYGPINRLPKAIGTADRQRLTTAYRQAILTELVPSCRKMADFLEREYLPKARASSGIGAVPGGPALYTYAVAAWTTTDLTPAQIRTMGLKEVARIRKQMEEVQAQVGFKGTLRAFFESLKTDPKAMPFKTPAEVLAAFHAIQARIDPNLKKIFGRVPKSPFEIRQTEKFREASASAEYNQGSPDGSRPGIFYVPLPDATKFNVTSGMESLFLHEAIPGHHYQTSLQQENTGLPKFRRFAWYGAMGEGWALYCESLGPELGLYTDPYQRIGALNDEMLRAVRLVVDTGLHTGQLTREQAIAYMLDNMPTSEADATSAIERYMAWPGQALSYKVGALKIRALREKYAQQLGSKFSLSNFHDELLKDGVMPLAVLERKMDAWASSQ